MARVGLLEDNTVIARLSATMLQYVGHQVTIYEHPQECLNALSLTGTLTMPGCSRVSQTAITLPVELLILDLHLPKIGGFHVLELILSHPHTCSLPLVFCTAATEREIDDALRIAPQARLVEKPFKMETLLSAVSTLLQHQ